MARTADPLASERTRTASAPNERPQRGDDEATHFARELARLAQAAGRETESSRALFPLARALLVAAADGHTALPLEARGSKLSGEPTPLDLRSLLALQGVPARELDDALDWCRGPQARPWVGAPGEASPLVLERDDGEYLSLHRLWWLESQLARRLRRLTSQARPLRPLDTVSRALERVLDSGAERSTRALSDEQRRAIVTAAVEPLTVITGGPGTGKTSIVMALLRLLNELGVATHEIALAAPTGKAAFRLSDTLRHGDGARPWPVAQTLHRLLDYYDSGQLGTFGHHEARPLPHRVVIVDEGSMVDLGLMFQLLRALRSDGQLVLVGDSEQLPSVDAGAVFRELAQGGPHVARLGRSFRIDTRDPGGRAVSGWVGELQQPPAASQEVRPEGRPLQAQLPLFQQAPTVAARPSESRWLALRQSADEVTFSGIELLAPGAAGHERRRLLDRWALERVASAPELARWCRHVYRLHHPRDAEWEGDEPAAPSSNLVDHSLHLHPTLPPEERAMVQQLLDHHERRRILCATHEDDRAASAMVGVDSVNRHQRDHFRHIVEPHLPNVAAHTPHRPGAPMGLQTPIAGEPVMVQRNLYRLGLFNGDQGVLLRVAHDDDGWQWMALFRTPQGELRAYPLSTLRRELSSAFATTVHKAQGAEHDEVVVLLPEVDLPLATREWLYTAATRSRRAVLLVGSAEQLDQALGRRSVRISRLGARLASER